MINYLPLLVALFAMFILQKEWSNKLAAGWFGLFYCGSICISYVFEGEAQYFVWSIVSTPLFLLILSKLSKITPMILLLCASDIILTLIDVGSFVTYNIPLDGVYQWRWNPERIVIIIQVAALLVRDGRHINISTIYGNMAMFARHTYGLFHYQR